MSIPYARPIPPSPASPSVSVPTPANPTFCRENLALSSTPGRRVLWGRGLVLRGQGAEREWAGPVRRPRQRLARAEREPGRFESSVTARAAEDMSQH